MENKLVSIIIPVYDVEAYLRKCLDSIKNQTYRFYEVIMVDDGSHDSSAAICKAYTRDDPRFILIQKENAGQGSARNVGLDVARGEYISFVDSDDWIHEQYLEILLNRIDSTNADIVVCNVERVFNNGRKNKLNGIRKTAETIDQPVTYLPRASMSVCDKLYKKTLFEELRFPEKMKYEDFALMPQIIVRAKKIEIIEDTLYYYYWRDGSTTNQKRVNRDILKAQHILEESELLYICPTMLQMFFVKNVMGSLIWGILKEKKTNYEVRNIMYEGLSKYPGLPFCDFSVLMGRNKKKYGMYLVQGNYQRARVIVLLNDGIMRFIKKALGIFMR